MGAGKSQEQKDKEIYDKANQLLQENGYEPVTSSTTKVPEHFGGKWPAKWFFGAVNRISPRMPDTQKAKLYAQKFTIGAGPALSRYDRKNLSLINPENPFDTEPGEGEERVFAFIDKHKDKVGLARGGKYHGDRMEHCGRRKFF